MISRRAFLGVAAIVTARLKPRAPFSQDETQDGARGFSRAIQQDGARGFSRAVEQADGYAVDINGARSAEVSLDRNWTGPLCRSRIHNRGKIAARIQEVVLFDIKL